MLTTGFMVQIYLHSMLMNFTKSGLRVLGFCPAGSTCKVDLTFGESEVGLEYVSWCL